MERLRETILSIRQDLLCEHLGVTPEVFASAMNGASGSLVKTVEALRGPGRTLKALQPADVAADESLLAENELLDPERPPPNLRERFSRSLSDIAGRVGIRGKK